MNSRGKKLRIIVSGMELMESLSPHFVLCCIVQAVLAAVSPFINIYLSAVMINGLTGGKSLRHMLFLVLLTVTLNLLCQGLGCHADRAVNVKQSVLTTQFQWALNQKMMELPFADVESHAVQALREKIRQMENVNGMGLRNLILGVQTAFQSIFSILFAAAAFCSVFFVREERHSGNVLTDFFCSPGASALLAGLIALSIAVSLWTVSQSARKIFQAYAGLVPLNQIYTYYLENYIDTYHSGKDIRLYRQGDLIRAEMEAVLSDARTPMKKLKGIEFRYKGLGEAAVFVMNLFIYLTVGLRALAGLFPVGNIVRYVGGVSQFITGFTTLSGQLTLLWENTEALEVILEYLGLGNARGQKEDRRFRAQRQKRIGVPRFPHSTTEEDWCSPVPAPIQIQFREVSFTYPGTDRKALDHLSFTIHAGERLAVVGRNGSGKTTMIKLLCRLYDADEGEILLNGTDIRSYDVEAYRKLFGVVFQDFQLFSFGLGQNLAGSAEYDADRARDALEEADFGPRLKEMSLETSLYRDFDPLGIEISGGEAQKIAIARAIYKQAPILVLDEPTAALDPRAEYEVYQNLNRASENRTAVFISHRMSSCRFCDRILVFGEGCLVQEGTHEELLKEAEGKYRQLWSAQEQYYS